MFEVKQALHELATAAARYRAVVDGFELDYETSALVERTLAETGVDETSFRLAQRLVRTAGTHVAYVRSEDPGESLSDLCARAAELARGVAAGVPAGLVAPGEGSDDDAEAGASAAVLPAVDRAAMDAAARQGLEALRAAVPGALQPRCTVRFYAEGHTVVNSAGLVRSGAAGRYQMRLGYIARAGDEMNPVECRAYAAHPTAFDVAALVRRCTLLGEAPLGNMPLTSGDYPVVIPGYVLSRMLMGFWGIFSAQKIADGQSMLAGKQGARIASPLVTIVDDPGLAGGGPKLAFDVEGAPKRHTTLVDAGVFREPLSNLAAAHRLGCAKSSGNAARRDTLGRIVPNEITIAPSNIAFAPGRASLDDLLAQMGDGILLTEVNDIYHSFAFASGGISTPCAGALVRDGAIVGGIAALTLSDSIQHLLERIVALGCEQAWVDLEDLNAYYAGAPDVLVSSLHFVGSA